MPRQQKPLLDRLMNTSMGKVVHSSGYGTVQNPRGIGTASAQSFKERLVVDENREFVGRYKDARVMRESRNTLPQARCYQQEMSNDDARGTGRMITRGGGSAKSGIGGVSKTTDGLPNGATGRAQMAARFEPMKPMGGSMTPPARRNPGI